MFQQVPIRHSLTFHGQTLTLETGLLAQQATSSVLASLGQTTVLVAVVVGEGPANSDYFPLQVVYEERLYASGKIKGSRFVKREGKPSDNSILTGRMIDRSLRSLFDPDTRQEVQIVITPLSIDEVNPPDTLAVIAASAAIKLAGIEPFAGPVSSVRIGLIPEQRVNQLLATIKQKLETGTTDFSVLKPDLEEFCQLIDLKETEHKNLFGQVFQALAAVNTEWAAKLKLLYHSTTRLTQKEIAERYPNLELQPVVNPSYKQQAESVLDLVVSGDGQNVMMVEAGAKVVNEPTLGRCLDLACQELAVLTQFQKEFIALANQAGLQKSIILHTVKPNPKVIDYWLEFVPELEEVLYAPGKKLERMDLLESVKVLHQQVLNQLLNWASTYSFDQLAQLVATLEIDQKVADKMLQLFPSLEDLQLLQKDLLLALEVVKKKLIKQNILNQERRLDGRRLDETRPIMCQVDVVPRVHGSSLFQRGETQVLNILTIGSTRDAQTIDEMEDFEETTKRYMHHYNFPQYSVGAIGKYAGPGRREIGHGALAEKALLPVLPSEEEFPYTMRLVSECLGSNGSTSMASTCASCLSLMAGGVPIKDMVAGVAMGLVLDQASGQFKVLTDIIGEEDFSGDMDFKVAGTKDGITALQLDNKVAGLTVEILKQALIQAKTARLHILNIMQQTISQPRPELSPYAPRVAQLTIPVEKIGEVIGPSGKVIKALIAKTDTEIDIEDLTGRVVIFGKDAELVNYAAEYIKKIVKDYTLGEIVEGVIFRIEPYGAFVKVNGTEKEGLIHISQISDNKIKDIKSLFSIGQKVRAKVIEINDKGQLNLSIKMLNNGNSNQLT
jgi:polyribonucleotide nucleotidyltransferase